MNEAAERLRATLQRSTETGVYQRKWLDEALAAERRAFAQRVKINFRGRVYKAWGGEQAEQAIDLLRWAVDEEAAR